MSAFPDPPSTPPPRGSTDLTSSTPVRVMKFKETEDSFDPVMSSDDEPMQGPPKRIKLKHRGSADEAEKAKSPVATENDTPTEDGAFTEDDGLTDDGASAEHSAPSEGRVTPPASTDIEVECGVATPPATSPSLGPLTDAPAAIPDEIALASPKAASPIPDAASASDEPPSSRSSSPDDVWCASDYPIFDPDDEASEFEIFTDAGAYKEYMLKREMWEGGFRFTRHLHECLRGSARNWYENELTDEEREQLSYGSLTDWLCALWYRFEVPWEEVEERIRNDPWDWDRVRKGDNIEDWLDDQFLRAKPYHEYHWEALHFVWQQIQPVLRKDVPEPGKSSEYQDFLSDLECAETEWRYMVGIKDE